MVFYLKNIHILSATGFAVNLNVLLTVLYIAFVVVEEIVTVVIQSQYHCVQWNIVQS